MMRWFTNGLVAAATLLASAAAADQPAAWTNAAALAERVWSDVQGNGILAVGRHAENLEAALVEGRQVGPQVVDGDTTYVLTDGGGEALVAMLAAANNDGDDASQGVSVVAIDNPYPLMALVLGSYYVESRQPEEGIRVLELGLAIIDASSFGGLSETRPALLTERGMALTSLNRFEEALASFDEGLGMEGLEPASEAHLLRGRGFALIELDRLDEAEEAYLASLQLEPGNETAIGELAYIAGLKGGAKPTAPDLVPLQPE
jgi:tetratricopeptide (TPR) repeat protein